MMHQFSFKGGANNPMPGTSIKFMSFLVSGGREIPFLEARRNGLVLEVLSASMSDALHNVPTYETDCDVIKVFVLEQEFGKPRFMYSFYLMLGVSLDPQHVLITPRHSSGRAYGWGFSAEARFLRKSEALELLDPASLAAKILTKQEMPPVDVLRKFVTIIKPRAVQQASKTRRLRLE